MLGENLIGSEV